MIAAIVAPAGLRRIARMRACLVSDRADVSGDECADRRGLDLLIVCPAERIETLDFDLDFVMGSSEVMRRHPPHHLSPARAKPGRARPRSQPQPLPKSRQQRSDQTLEAFNPVHGVRFLSTHGFLGFAVLGGVFLALTGGAALYADIGHIGRNPIRVAWFCFVLPELFLTYAGQLAHFIDSPDLEANPFFK